MVPLFGSHALIKVLDESGRCLGQGVFSLQVCRTEDAEGEVGENTYYLLCHYY